MAKGHLRLKLQEKESIKTNLGYENLVFKLVETNRVKRIQENHYANRF